jgi:hypothetical protein
MQADPGHLWRDQNIMEEKVDFPIVTSSATWIVFWPLFPSSRLDLPCPMWDDDVAGYLLHNDHVTFF